MHRTLACLALTLATAPALACPDNSHGWSRHGDPVLRDPIFFGVYEAAADGHVFVTNTGQLAMIYSGDSGDHSSIKLALSDDWINWERAGPLLGPEHGPREMLNKETSFYFQDQSGRHQIYFIGYEDGEVYDSQIFRATSDNFDGPYVVNPTPVIATGMLAGNPVEVITSPSVVEHEGRLYLSFIGWDGFQDVTTVWILGTTSDDMGDTWGPVQEVPVPIGMEGQVTPMPGGGYVAARTGGEDGAEGIYISCADHPFGPYSQPSDPVLVQSGPPWEADEIIAPQVAFDPVTGTPRLYYSGAVYDQGWWIMLAE